MKHDGEVEHEWISCITMLTMMDNNDVASKLKELFVFYSYLAK